MDKYILLLTIIGLAALGMAWMPAFTRRTGISYSIVYIAAGAVLYLAIPGFLPSPAPRFNESATLRLSELVVIISLMGTGIKIDRRFSVKNWATPLKLVFITMILCIAGAAILGYAITGLDMASALLMAAVLAPTDPVLASDVQVGKPNEGGGKSETKFSLTAEAGMNDGMAFPFTWLAIAVATGAGTAWDFAGWFAWDFLYRIIAGVAVGFLMGKIAGYLVFRASDKFPLFKTRDGFLAISLTLFVYGVTELIHGYGFISVFVCAVTLRHYEKEHDYHDELHSFTDQSERLLIAVLLLLFGGSLVSGILDHLTLPMAIFSLVFLFIIRPLSGLITLIGSGIHLKERLAISFLGIRGMGSIFYLAFALKETRFSFERELWSVLAFTILVSVIIHGLTANPIMKNLSRTMKKEETPL